MDIALVQACRGPLVLALGVYTMVNSYRSLNAEVVAAVERQVHRLARQSDLLAAKLYPARVDA